MTKKVPGTILALACLTAFGCGRESEPPPQPPAATPVSVEEPASCAPCHAAETSRWLASAHRLAARPIGDATQPPRATRAADAPILPAGRDAASFDAAGSLLAPDANGAVEAREISHVLGGRRREDFLSPRGDGPHVLPLSWSVTRSAWTDPAAEERGATIDPKGPLGWTKHARAHRNACSRCHPVGDSGPGIACSTCHPDALAHARERASAQASQARPAGSPSDPWNGCGPCHAVGLDMPRVADARGAGPLVDALLPDTLVLAEGFNPSFALDGRPIVPHGREAQSLAQSACFLKGGANCLTCHDPHGGDRTSLKDPDPDASCRACHATIAAEPATHARHPVATSVPLAIDEPGGPWIVPDPRPTAAKPRLPGCVDCHAPAVLGFSPADTVRDHAIGIPDPTTAQGIRAAHACAACHPGWGEKRLAPALPGKDSPPARRARAKTFAAAARAMFAGGGATDQREALDGALAMLGDAALDPWTRASAASLVGTLGRPARGASSARADLAAALEAAWSSSTDPVLRRAIASAHPLVGGTSDALATMLASETDWRVRVAGAAALSSLADPRGTDMLESIRRDAALPGRAHADAAFELGSALVSSGSTARGEALLLESLAAWPDNAAAWVNLGAARVNAGNRDGAREAWERALELSPGNPIARANLESLAKDTGASASEAGTP